MGNFIINSVLWTFALYGLFELIKQIIYMCTYTNLKEDGIYVIIAAKNQEEKMAKDYEYLKVSNWKECKDIIDNIDNN